MDIAAKIKIKGGFGQLGMRTIGPQDKGAMQWNSKEAKTKETTGKEN